MKRGKTRDSGRKGPAGDTLQAEKMAAIATLAAEIAHEFNNPLHYISNYLYLLSTELPQDFKGAEYIEKIQGGIDSLAAMTKSLLEFSRPPQDEFALVDIHSTLDAALAQIMDTAAAQRYELRKEFRCRAATVRGSDRMLQQVFMQVFQNAVDAMSEGGRLTVSTACSKGSVLVAIEDNGIGIPERNISRVFDPFFSTRKNSKRGTGLGLSVSYNVIKQHLGEIRLTSIEGQGTKVTIILPKSSV